MESLLTTQRMDETTKYWVVKAMLEYGGSFVHNLGKALQSADGTNTLRIQHAFPEYISQYMDIGLKMKEKDSTTKEDAQDNVKVEPYDSFRFLGEDYFVLSIDFAKGEVEVEDENGMSYTGDFSDFGLEARGEELYKF